MIDRSMCTCHRSETSVGYTASCPVHGGRAAIRRDERATSEDIAWLEAAVDSDMWLPDVHASLVRILTSVRSPELEQQPRAWEWRCKGTGGLFWSVLTKDAETAEHWKRDPSFGGVVTPLYAGVPEAQSPDVLGDVLAFRRKHGMYIGSAPSLPPSDLPLWWSKKLVEEALETAMALAGPAAVLDVLAVVAAEVAVKRAAPDLTEVADGCADVACAVANIQAICGFDPGPVWREVHRSNMEKEGDGQGNVWKGKDWTPPTFTLRPLVSSNDGSGESDAER